MKHRGHGSATTRQILVLQERVLTLEAALVLIVAQGGAADHSACSLEVCPFRIAEVALRGKAVGK